MKQILWLYSIFLVNKVVKVLFFSEMNENRYNLRKIKRKAKDDTSSDEEISISEEKSNTVTETESEIDEDFEEIDDCIKSMYEGQVVKHEKQFGCKRRVYHKKNECLDPLQMDYRNYGNIPGLKENYQMMFEKMISTEALSKFYSLHFFENVFFFLL